MRIAEKGKHCQTMPHLIYVFIRNFKLAQQILVDISVQSHVQSIFFMNIANSQVSLAA